MEEPHYICRFEKMRKDLIIRLHKLLGNRWSLIAGRLPGRTDNEIKNYWNTNIEKKLTHVRNQNEPMPSMSSLPLHNHHQNPSPPTLTCVIRTKATRCTKVVISKELQNIQQKKNCETEMKPFETAFNTNDSMETLLTGPQVALNQGSMRVLDESKLSNLKIDTEVDPDGHILSILEAHELLPYIDLHHLQQQQQQQQQQKEFTLMSSPLMIDNWFMEENMQGEFDVDWIKWFLQTKLGEETSNKV